MTLRTRIAVAATVAAAIAALGVAVLGVLNTRHELRSQVDGTLLGQAQSLVQRLQYPGSPSSTSPPSSAVTDDHDRGGRRGPAAASPDDDDHEAVPFAEVPYRVIDASGALVDGSSFGTAFAPDDRDLAVAAGESGPTLRDRYVDGEHFRIATVPAGSGLALQTLRSMADVDGTVRSTTLGFALIGLVGMAIAALLGVLVARAALVPVARLSRAVDDVASHLDLRSSVPESGGAELSRLGRSFNTALAALDLSRRQQQRLVQDAAHELRTPLTSLRTNVEVLQQFERLPADERRGLLADVSAQLDELSRLVADLGMLSRQDAAEPDEHVECRLDEIVRAAIDRARPRLGPGVAIDARLEPEVVEGVPALLERAVLNVIDNAAKWGPPGEPITVVLHDGELTVADRGPGIAPEERALVFERFWRSPGARAQPGSGLGLAIVRQVLEAHHGTVVVEANPGGGTLVRMRLPVSPLADEAAGEPEPSPPEPLPPEPLPPEPSAWEPSESDASAPAPSTPAEPGRGSGPGLPAPR